MNKLQSVKERLSEIVADEDNEALDQLGSYIVGALIVDDEADELCQNNEMLARIADLGSNLEIRNGGDEWMQKDWQELKQLVDKLNQDGR